MHYLDVIVDKPTPSVLIFPVYAAKQLASPCPLTPFSATLPSHLRVLAEVSRDYPPVSSIIATHPQSTPLSPTIATHPKKLGVVPVVCLSASVLALPQPQALLFQAIAHSFANFCICKNRNSFVFSQFRTLCAKHPGGGYPLTPKSTFSKGFAPLPRTFSAKGRFVHSFTCPEDVHPTYYWSLRAPRAKLFPGQGISLRVYRFRLHGGCYG
jgi:hypothetical protein